MTEKIARRGRPVPSEYSTDHLEQVLVRDVALRDVITLKSTEVVESVRQWLRSGAPEAAHHGFPVIDAAYGGVLGVLTQRDLFAEQSCNLPLGELVSRRLIAVHPEASLREAADTMFREGVGRLPIIDHGRLLGIVTRSDLLRGHESRLVAASRHERSRRLVIRGWPGSF